MVQLQLLLGTGVAALPLVSAAAIERYRNETGQNALETDEYARRAWINQQDYQKSKASNSWTTCNANNTVVRKEWCAHTIPTSNHPRH